MDKRQTLSEIGWGKVSKTWSADSACCLKCEHRIELTSSALVDNSDRPAVSEQFCAVLTNGSNNDYLDCPAVIKDGLLSIAPHRQNYMPPRGMTGLEKFGGYVLAVAIAIFIVLFILNSVGALKA